MQKKSIASAGLVTGVSVFLFFTFGFLLLGYASKAYLVLGILGGLAGGLIVTWWHNDEKPIPPNTSSLGSPKSLPSEAGKNQSKSGKNVTKVPLRSTRKAVTLLDWLFRQNRS